MDCQPTKEEGEQSQTLTFNLFWGKYFLLRQNNVLAVGLIKGYFEVL